MSKKICFITSLDVNVGDEFIREGISSFFDDILDDWSPYYVNKVDLTTICRQVKDERKSIGDKLVNADIVVQAGAPVYWKIGASTCYNVEWAEELWFKRIFRLGPQKHILNIAAGACQPFPDVAKTFLSDPACVDFALQAYQACRWTSVRDPLASQILHALAIEHDALPCAAFHAARRLPLIEPEKNLVGINLMKLGGHFRLREDISPERWLTTIKSVLQEVRRNHKILFIAHDQAEMQFMDELALVGEDVFLSASHIEYMKRYARCSMVIANRVHGGVCAAGFGRPAIIIGNDTRLQIADYIGINNHYVGNVTAENILNAFEELKQNLSSEAERLIELRESSATRYCTAIKDALELQKYKATPLKRSLFPMPNSIASVAELNSTRFVNFMNTMNCYAERLSLRKFTNWSKVWEYPWLWFNALSGTRDWKSMCILDLGSEISPMPWFLASFGAKVTLVECDEQWIPRWAQLKAETGLDVDWQIVTDERLPFDDLQFDIVTSFSVIEHQKDKQLAVAEVCRVLKPGGLFALSFDICEPSMGMTFPEWNGCALTMAEFEAVVWNYPGFLVQGKPEWNVEDIPLFVEWHKKSAEYHNYAVGAAVLCKKVFDDSSVKRILLPRFDTHGDIVLLKGFIDAMLEHYPEAEVTLYVREGYDQLKPLFSDRLIWLTQPFNPWARYSSEELAVISTTFHSIASEPWDIVLFTTYNRTFLEDILAAILDEPVCIGLGKRATHLNWQKRLFAGLSLSDEKLYDHIVPVEELSHETEKYQRFWELLFDQNSIIPLPKIEVSDDQRKAAEAVLLDLGLQPGSFVACMPAGVQNVKIKKWPEERYSEVLDWLSRERSLLPLLIGHESEQEILEKLKFLAKAQGADVKIWLGKHGDMGVLAALLEKASLYLGNDSAPMHIASALDIPTVGIFGGGHWPRFNPTGSRCIAVTSCLPCFYCDWDCIFGEAHCVRLVPVRDVTVAIDTVLSGEVGEDHIQHAAASLLDESRELIAQASRRHRELKSQLLQMQEHVDELLCALEDSSADIVHTHDNLDIMHKSLSWRLTAPIRNLLDEIRKIGLG